MSDRLYIATRKGLFTAHRTNAHRWTIVDARFLGDNITIVAPDCRSGSLYAALDHGHFGVKLHRSSDGGATWEECPAPAYPEPPAGYEGDRCPMSGIPIPRTLKLIWSLVPGGQDQPGRLWCGTVPGGLFRSDDAGSSWEFIRALWDDPRRKAWFGGGLDYPGIHSICVDPRDSRRVALGVSCGGVWLTEDDGATWECRADGMHADYMPPELRTQPQTQDPHCLVQCRDKPDVFWAQHHNGVFRTTDGARSWHEIKNVQPSVFGFAVAVHPCDPDVAWFVPAIKDEQRIPVGGRVVVARTRDGGETFDLLCDGLPQNHAYDLTYRHALHIDDLGVRLAFGSTTGSLWVSENSGDRWTCVSNNLPPIHCVRFG